MSKAVPNIRVARAKARASAVKSTRQAPARATNARRAEEWVAWGLRTGRLTAGTAPGWRERIVQGGAAATAALQALPDIRTAMAAVSDPDARAAIAAETDPAVAEQLRLRYSGAQGARQARVDAQMRWHPVARAQAARLATETAGDDAPIASPLNWLTGAEHTDLVQSLAAADRQNDLLGRHGRT